MTDRQRRQRRNYHNMQDAGVIALALLLGGGGWIRWICRQTNVIVLRSSRKDFGISVIKARFSRWYSCVCVSSSASLSYNSEADGRERRVCVMEEYEPCTLHSSLLPLFSSVGALSRLPFDADPQNIGVRYFSLQSCSAAFFETK